MKCTDRMLIACSLVALALGGCSGPDTGSMPPASNAPTGSTASTVTDQWLGQWNGPEATFLRIEGGQGKYAVIIQNLDGARNYAAHAVDDQIRFERNGVTESIRATNGEATGMKWLSDKTNCLTVKSGEGYCRD